MHNEQLALASRLKNARKNANLTQDQVAQSLALQRTAIVQIEAGNRAVSTLELSKLAQLYGCPISSFFSSDDTPIEEDALVALFRATQTEGDGARGKRRLLDILRSVELESNWIACWIAHRTLVRHRISCLNRRALWKLWNKAS